MFLFKNNKMKQRLFILLVISSLSLMSFAQGASGDNNSGSSADSLTLKSVIGEIISKHPTVMGAIEALNAADARIGLAKTGYYPNVDAGANFSYIGPVIKITIPNMGSFQLYPNTNYSAAINVRQPILDFGRTRENVMLETENKAYGELTVEQVKQKMSMAAVNNFYTLAFLQDAIVIKDEEIKALNEHLKFVETKKLTGSATDYEVLTTQVRITTAESQKVDLLTAKKIQQSYMNSLLGRPESNVPVVKKELVAVMPQINNDSLLDYALKNRDEMLLAKKKMDIARIRYDLTRTLNRPYLGFVATGGAKNGYLPELNALKMNYVLGLGFTVPLYDARKTKYNLDQVKVAMNGLDYEQEATKRTVTSEVDEAEAYVTSAMQKVKQFELQLLQAEKAYSLAEISYKAGTITNLDLLDSSTMVSQSRLLLLKAKIDYAASLYRLKAVTGERLY